MVAALLHQFAQLTITAELAAGGQQQLHTKLQLERLRGEGMSHRHGCNEIATRELLNNSSVIALT
jgi:hypothetical protein